MGADQGRRIEPAPLPPAPPTPGAVSDWLARGLETRRDLNAARARLEAGRLEEQVAKVGFKPEVALVGRYDLYDDAIFGSSGDSGSLMAVARINLYRAGADDARLEAARFRTSAAESETVRFEHGVELEVRQAWQELTTARARQTSAHAALDSAREGLRVRELRFRQGLDTMLDLLDAETALREAETRELVARYDLALAAWRLHFVSGASLIDLLNLTEEE
jgi:outer membrane protein TolC